MKIAIPVDSNSNDTNVCISFGRTPYFMIFNTQTKESEFIDNSAAASQGGAGIKASQMLVDLNVEALITPRCGQNAADVLNGAKIKIYKTINDNLKENIDLFLANKLSPLNKIHAGFHNHGGND